MGIIKSSGMQKKSGKTGTEKGEKRGGKRMLTLVNRVVAAGETDQLQRLDQEPEFLNEMLENITCKG